jgi:hypothetical protein
MDSEWIGALYKHPGLVREAGENMQVDVVLWMEIPSGLIISTTLIDSRKPISFADSFEEAIQSRGKVSLPRPTSIRVPNDRLAKELRSVAGGIPLVVAPVPEVDAAFAELAQMVGDGAQASYLGDGDIPEDVVAEFFDAAYSLFHTAPWRVVAEEQIIGVDIPKLKVKGACLSVIGGGRVSRDTRQKRPPRFFDKGDCLFAGNAWKVVEELLDGLATFEVIEQGLRRNARAYEDGRSADDLRVGVHDLLRVHDCKRIQLLIRRCTQMKDDPRRAHLRTSASSADGR